MAFWKVEVVEKGGWGGQQIKTSLAYTAGLGASYMDYILHLSHC